MALKAKPPSAETRAPEEQGVRCSLKERSLQKCCSCQLRALKEQLHASGSKPQESPHEAGRLEGLLDLLAPARPEPTVSAASENRDCRSRELHQVVKRHCPKAARAPSKAVVTGVDAALWSEEAPGQSAVH